MKSETKANIIALLSLTDRGGVEKLVNHMVINGFFEAPCSGGNHLSEEGGLAEHSLNVYKALKKLNDSLEAKLPEDEIIICSLLHDLGKMGDHGKANYTPNMVKSKTKNKETGEYELIQSTAKPYVTNSSLNYEEHEVRSVIIAERFIFLSEDEETAILHHNGLFGKLDSAYGNHNFDKTRLAFLLHTADMWASRFMEGEQD